MTDTKERALKLYAVFKKAVLKYAVRVLLWIALWIALFAVFHVAATTERGYEAVGGEALIPFVPFAWRAARGRRRKTRRGDRLS